MTNFIFKSQKGLTKNSPIEIAKADLLMKNVLHLTYQNDKILRLLNKINNDLNLQTQVDDYYDNQVHPEDKQDLD